MRVRSMRGAYLDVLNSMTDERKQTQPLHLLNGVRWLVVEGGQLKLVAAEIVAGALTALWPINGQLSMALVRLTCPSGGRQIS